MPGPAVKLALKRRSLSLVDVATTPLAMFDATRSVAGQCLNFNCMMVLVLMLRHCITYLRTRGFSQFLPLDQHIYFHKVTGVLIFVYSSVHTVSHLLNFSE